MPTSGTVDVESSIFIFIIEAVLQFPVPKFADYVTVVAYLLPYVPPFAVFFVITVVAVVVAAVFTAIVVIPTTTSGTPIIPAILIFLVPNFADYVTVVADLCPYVPPFASALYLAILVIGSALIAGDVVVSFAEYLYFFA